MFIVGLTGGIGSGKSAASDHFQRLGISIVDADIVAREVVEPGKPAFNAIVEHFGQDILTAETILDRAKLRQRIFENAKEKAWLETLLHPIIRQEIQRQLVACEGPYAILVSPLLFETNQQRLVDRTLLIDVPEKLQLARASSRDQNSTEQIQKIIDSQLPRDVKLARADDVILNDKSLADLKIKVEQQHAKYLESVNAQNS
jgi:dephospho-CoA kinase